VTTYLIAPPGTAVGEPGWHAPPAGLLLKWDHLGMSYPPVAVQRDGILVASGCQTGYTAEQERERNRVLYGSCEACGIPRTAVEIQHEPVGPVFTLICPAGCDHRGGA